MTTRNIERLLTFGDAIPFVYDDGGRTDAGHTRKAGDCFTRALAIASGRPYQDVHDLVNEYGSRERRSKRRKSGKSSADSGVYTATARRIMRDLGYDWIPTMQVGSGCRVHLRSDELPDGAIVCRLSRHFAAVVDGVLRDKNDCSRNGTRCVYGYWIVRDP